MDHKGVVLINTPLTNRVRANWGQDPTLFFKKKKNTGLDLAQMYGLG